jgi:hypothetical protein
MEFTIGRPTGPGMAALGVEWVGEELSRSNPAFDTFRPTAVHCVKIERSSKMFVFFVSEIPNVVTGECHQTVGGAMTRQTLNG